MCRQESNPALAQQNVMSRLLAADAGALFKRISLYDKAILVAHSEAFDVFKMANVFILNARVFLEVIIIYTYIFILSLYLIKSFESILYA